MCSSTVALSVLSVSPGTKVRNTSQHCLILSRRFRSISLCISLLVGVSWFWRNSPPPPPPALCELGKLGIVEVAVGSIFGVVVVTIGADADVVSAEVVEGPSAVDVDDGDDEAVG